MRYRKILQDQKDSAYRKGQAAIELAVFGAILIFIIGIIIRSGLSASHTMNAQLRAMRMALTESYITAEGAYLDQQGRPSAARNSAAILLIEDRLSVDPNNKFATRDRFPVGNSATGTFSKNLFFPVEFGEVENLPLYDVIINGLRFPFTLGSFKIIDLPGGGGATAPETGPGLEWRDNCYRNNSGDLRGCYVFYKIAGNYNTSLNWCDSGNCLGNNIPASERFDLSLDGSNAVPSSQWDTFNWQWFQVAGVQDPDGPKIVLGNDGQGYGGFSTEPQMTAVVDADGDLKEETVLRVDVDGEGRVTRLYILDGQEGDIDFSVDDRVPLLERPGLMDDMYMKSITEDDTVYLLEEGRILQGQQAVQTTNWQDHIDVVQRGFRITRDTHRFCHDGAPTDWESPPYMSVLTGNVCSDPEAVDCLPVIHGVRGLTNPVEVCVATNKECFTASTIDRTCMVPSENTIWVRSRIEDTRARRWITPIDD